MKWTYWAILSAFFAGVTAVLAKIGVAKVDPTLATAIRTAVVLLFSWSLAFLNQPAFPAGGISRRSWIFLVLSGLATGLSWVCYFRALQSGPASRVAAVDKLSVVFAILLAVVFLGEKLGGLQWLGAGLILLGAVILALK